MKGRTLRLPSMLWLVSLMSCAVAVEVAFVYLDLPIARHFHGKLTSAAMLATGFASHVLLSIEAAIALTLLVVRRTRGHLSPFREAMVLACLASICAYAVNDSVLKLFFGVPNVSSVMSGARHSFHLLGGTSTSSFPSGHMVLSGAFAGVFMRLYRASILPLCGLLTIAAALLIAGDWHFISDVIAGSFVGISAGLLAGGVWLAHSEQ